jgi:hypothetical protein
MWSVYVISLITSVLLGNEQDSTEFPLQQWLRERAKMLRYTYMAWLLVKLCRIIAPSNPLKYLSYFMYHKIQH